MWITRLRDPLARYETMASTVDYEHGISAIDAGYNRPAQVAIHLLVEGQRAAFIDTGIPRSVPAALDALTVRGLQPEQVDYVIVTHVHLDHAGGAGRLMQACPNARLVVHPRGARHLIDPANLLAGVAAVARDEGRRGWFDPRDRVMHMGYLYGLVEAPAASEGPAIVQLLRFIPRHQWAFRWHERRMAKDRARRRSPDRPGLGGAFLRGSGLFPAVTRLPG